LLADREREATEKAKAAAAAAAAAAAETKKQEDETRRARKKLALGNEPKEWKAEDDEICCKIAARMPQRGGGKEGGKKVQRTFRATDVLEKVFDWLDVEGLEELRGAKVVLAGGRGRGVRMAYVYPEDKHKTLGEAGIEGQVSLLVESGGGGAK